MATNRQLVARLEATTIAGHEAYDAMVTINREYGGRVFALDAHFMPSTIVDDLVVHLDQRFTLATVQMILNVSAVDLQD